MAARQDDSVSSPHARVLLALAFSIQAALLVALLSWVGHAQEIVPAAAPIAAVRTPLAMPRAVSSFGAAELDGWHYVLGGHTGRTHRYSAESQWDGFVRLRADDPSVREELPGGMGLQGTALVAAGGKLVRVGGMQAKGSGGEVELVSVASVAAFDPATRGWSELPALPRPRSSHDAAVIGSRVFIFGGWSLAGHPDEAHWFDHGLVLDLARPAQGWQRLPQPFVQRGVAMAASAREIFVLGGMDEEGGFSSAVDAFDPTTETWRKAPDYPGEGFGLGAVVKGQRLYVSGRSGELWALALANEERWERQGDLVLARSFHRILPAGDELAILGGATMNHPVGWIERLRPGAPSPCAARFEIPFAGRARQRQALFLHEGTLYHFGGNVALDQHAFEPEDFLDEAWRFELGAGTVAALPALPAGRQSMTCVGTPDGKGVLALGGFGHDGRSDRTFDEIWCCDLASGQWRLLPAHLPAPMTQFRALVHGDELLLVGGMDFERERAPKMKLRDEIHSAQLGDPGLGFRDTGLRLSAPRRAFGAALVGEHLYVAGGLDEDFEAVTSFDMLDLASGAWTRLAAPSQGRLSPELVALGGKLYLCGGLVFDPEGRALPAGTIEEFDPARSAWRTLADPLPLDPREVQAFAWREKLAFVSTWNQRGVLELVLLDPRPKAGAQ